jgi:hypothetical protein
VYQHEIIGNNLQLAIPVSDGNDTLFVMLEKKP